MIDWLYALPDWLLLVLWASTLAGLIMLLPLLTHRIRWLRPNAENSDFVLRLQATMFTITSFVVAFTLVEAVSNYRKVDALVSIEASNINRLDRLLYRYEHDSADRVRPQLLGYARSVVTEEWPRMLRGPSTKTHQAFVVVSRGIFALEPSPGRQTTMHAEILRSYDSVAESRESRLSAASIALSATFWQAMLLAVLILLFVSSTIERNRFRAIILGCQMGMLGTFTGFVFIWISR
jgi:hypothetical protein